ncbi:MAG: cupin domain-containing protein [Balneolaceae bacterium]
MNEPRSPYIHTTDPAHIPVPGGKTIAEYIGRVATETESVSIARMEAPAGWEEPAQQPAFDEVTILLEGRMMVEIDGEEITLQPGETILARRGEKVRYSNPFPETAVYWSVCVPAFSPKSVHRDTV